MEESHEPEQNEQQTTTVEQTQQEESTHDSGQVVSEPAGTDSAPQAPAVDAATYDEVRGMADEVLGALDDVSRVMADAAASQATDAVTLNTTQYEELRQMASAQLTGDLVIGGLLAVMVGLLFVMIITVHWKVR